MQFGTPDAADQEVAAGAKAPAELPPWVLSRNQDEGRLEALHHPFTAPNAADVAGGGDIRTARAQAYDLVLNGTEIGGERD